MPSRTKLLLSLLYAFALSLAGCAGKSDTEDRTADTSHSPDYRRLELVAGRLGGWGNVDGPFGRFVEPVGIAMDANGLLYVSDEAGDVIRTVNVNGEIATLHRKNPNQIVQHIDSPKVRDMGVIAVDSKKNIYMVALSECQVQKITPNGERSVFAGGACGYRDGGREQAQFGSISSIVTDKNDVIYLADTTNYVIRKITTNGTVSTFAGTPRTDGVTNGEDRDGHWWKTIEDSDVGKQDGVRTEARFLYPMHLALAGNGTLYVSDGYKVLRMISPEGNVTTFSGLDAQGNKFAFTGLSAMTVDSKNNLYVLDGTAIRKITPQSKVSRFVGESRNSLQWEGRGEDISLKSNIYDFPGERVVFWIPGTLTVDRDDNLYFANAFDKVISKISPNAEVSTYAGVFERLDIHRSKDGIGSAARFDCWVCTHWLYNQEVSNSLQMSVDVGGAIYVNDHRRANGQIYSDNYRIRKITTTGDVSTLTGADFESYGGATAKDGSRYWFTLDNRFYRTMANHLTGKAEVLYVAGSNLSERCSGRLPIDGKGDAACIFEPRALSVDNHGNAYFIDRDFVRWINFTSETLGGAIRKITPDGTISTIAGNFEQHGYVDGPGNVARFYVPTGLAVDDAGNVFVADTYNHLIRKIDTAGKVTTFAGTPNRSGSQDGGAAQASFNLPSHLAFDSKGNLFVADNGNYLIRKITPSGQVSTVAGQLGRRGVVLGALPANLSVILGMTVDFQDNLYLFSEYSVLRLTK